jgi:hypothetical protein
VLTPVFAPRVLDGVVVRIVGTVGAVGGDTVISTHRNQQHAMVEICPTLPTKHPFLVELEAGLKGSESRTNTHHTTL